MLASHRQVDGIDIICTFQEYFNCVNVSMYVLVFCMSVCLSMNVVNLMGNGCVIVSCYLVRNCNAMCLSMKIR